MTYNASSNKEFVTALNENFQINTQLRHVLPLDIPHIVENFKFLPTTYSQAQIPQARNTNPRRSHRTTSAD